MFGKKTDSNGFDSLRRRLDAMCAPAVLYQAEEKGVVRCLACGRRCHIAPGQRGVCQMRFNSPDPEAPETGRLMAPSGYTAGLAVDPVEKKPLFHVLPGSDALSYGMLGCNFHCDFCQNWHTSQVLRAKDADLDGRGTQSITAEEIVHLALQRRAPIIASTYNEPLITSEWSHEIMTRAKEQGIRTAYISNGFACEEVIDYLKPVLDIFKVDLKTMNPAHYQDVGGRLEPVLETIRRVWAEGFWTEIVTLVIPGFNDSDGELADMASFIADVSRDIPWHVTAFHPAYKGTTGERPTRATDIARAIEAGVNAGLRYVYAGNLRGELADRENTRCPECETTLIERHGFLVSRNRLDPAGHCPQCGHTIPGIWT